MKILLKNSLFWLGGIMIFCGLLLSSFAPNQLGDPWKVPESYQKMKNPVPANKQSLNIGKMLYNQHCKSCHGKEGLGDGPKAAELDTPSGDFTEDAFQKQSDGALFYKITKGRDDMPTYESKISVDEDRWHIVNYIRALAE